MTQVDIDIHAAGDDEAVIDHLLDGFDLARYMLAQCESDTTDMAASVYTVPKARYVDPAFWEEEVAMFKRVPLPLAASCELPRSNTYKAIELMDVPILLTRDKNGGVRAFRNTCSHRGAPLAEAGCGKARRFTCPYHGWTFDNEGRLIGITESQVFGDVDKSHHGLIELPCVERYGLIYGVLTPEAPLDIDEWLGPYARVLSAWDLSDFHFVSETRFTCGSSWKLFFEGQLENYHVKTLHEKWSKLLQKSGHFTKVGRHINANYAAPDIIKIRQMPESEWKIRELTSTVHVIFPASVVVNMYDLTEHESGFNGRFVFYHRTFPGKTPDTSVTIRTILSSAPLVNDAQRKMGHELSALLHEVVCGEDLPIVEKIQRGVSADSTGYFMFGRNERAIHYFHDELEKHRLRIT